MARNICTIIGSDKGGVGKSLLAQIFVAAHDQAGAPLHVIEIDNQRKLTSVYGDRVSLALDAAPKIESMIGDRMAAPSFFNQAHEYWVNGDCLTDLGANVTSALLDWASFVDLAGSADEDDVEYRFIAVASADDQSLRSAINALSQARRSLGHAAQLYLVLNQTSDGSGFRPYEGGDLWRQILQMQSSHRVRIIQIPYCSSSIMEWARALNLTFLDILSPNSTALNRISAQANFGVMDRRVQLRVFLNWVTEVQNALAPLFERQEDLYAGALQAAE